MTHLLNPSSQPKPQHNGQVVNRFEYLSYTTYLSPKCIPFTNYEDEPTFDRWLCILALAPCWSSSSEMKGSIPAPIAALGHHCNPRVGTLLLKCHSDSHKRL
mmetsp:Transcript_46455/g.106532  ORF Transcript_46455/g.106532 Transcript_46455/m.106532 type:complete len:102 (-) Transcript_46455:17-322(-)